MPDQYFGKYTGIVKDNRDDQNLGQVRVSVPTIIPPDDWVTARPALPYGFFFVPEIEAKVWIEFEGGDPDLPLWTGVQYVPGEWAAEAEANPPQKRVVKTASGHVLIFNDKGGEESIEIKDGVNGHIVRLDKDGVHVKDGKHQHELTFGSDGIVVEEVSGGKVEMTSGGIYVDSGKGAKVELTPGITSVDGGPGVVEVKGTMIKLSAAAALPILRVSDQGIGNLGAPVPLIGPGNPTVTA